MNVGRAIVMQMMLKGVPRVAAMLGADLIINVIVIERRPMQRHPAARGMVNMMIVDGVTSRIGHLGSLGRGKENEND